MGPSLSPFINLNPGYKVYTVDGGRGVGISSWNVLDFETWILNLTEANALMAEPRWFPLYRATEAYRIPNLLPTSLHALVQQLSTNGTMFDLYRR
jgi:sphingomyelin phosphodiesterase